MNDISKKINMHLTSWNVMSKLVDAYSIQSVQMWKTTVTLRESLSKVLNTHYCDMEKGNHCVIFECIIHNRYDYTNDSTIQWYDNIL